MNILYLHCHDAGRFVAPWNRDFPAPNLEKLAADSTVFTNAFTPSPTCSPSRGAMLTGTFPHENGLIGLTHLGFSFEHPEWHLANRLRDHGYQTFLAGIQHEFNGVEKAYKRVHAPGAKEQYADWDEEMAAAAASFLANHSGKAPFLLSVGFIKPHRGFPEPKSAARPSPPAGFPDTPEVRKDWQAYRECVASMDRAAGIVLDALTRSSFAENTLVVFTTDHGPAFPSMKCTLRDHGCGVALMIRPPGGGQSQEIDATVSHLDVLPTLLDYAGLPQPEPVRGHSLRPWIEAGEGPTHEQLYAEINFHSSYQPERAVRTEQWKYIARFEDDLSWPLANTDQGLTKEELKSRGFFNNHRPPEELYDLKKDPGETRNLASDPAYAAVKTRLRNDLLQWMQETKDPILNGPLPTPAGARLCPREAPSTAEENWEIHA